MTGESHRGYDRETGKIDGRVAFEEIDRARFGIFDLPYGTAVVNRIDTNEYRWKMYGTGGGFCHDTVVHRDRAVQLFTLAIEHSESEGSGVEITDYQNLKSSYQ